MENELTWSDRAITPRTKAYKDFVKEIKNTSPEFFFKDGERKFSNREKKFMQIYQSKESSLISGSAYAVKIIYNSNINFPIKTNFKTSAELVQFIDKQRTNAKVLIIQDNIAFREKIIDNEAVRQKFLSDTWANELENRTVLSSNLTPTQIDERQAYHYRMYEIESIKIGIEVNSFIEAPLWDEKAKSSSEQDFEENLIPASNLPKDWIWYEYDDGSGSLKSPNGNSYYGYDLQTQEYQLPDGNGWTSTRDFYNEPKTLHDFKIYVEKDLMDRVLNNNLSPKLTEEERRNLLNYNSLMKEKGMMMENLNIPKNQSGQFFKDNDIKINNKTRNIMENNKEFDQVQYLKNQLKYLGFGEDEKLHKDLEKGIDGKKDQFEIKTSSDKALPENKVDFILKFNKSDSGGVFFNSYNAQLTNEKKEVTSHNFPVNKENTFTAKESVNLLEGRAVKIEFQNPKSEKLESAFVKLNFAEPKTEKGNYNFQNFYENYGVDTLQIVEKSNLIFDKPEYKESTIKSLEKGNIVKVKFELDDKIIEGKAVLNPQYKNLNLYDQDMGRINTNKPLEGLEKDNQHEKNNVKEQSIKR